MLHESTNCLHLFELSKSLSLNDSAAEARTASTLSAQLHDANWEQPSLLRCYIAAVSSTRRLNIPFVCLGFGFVRFIKCIKLTELHSNVTEAVINSIFSSMCKFATKLFELNNLLVWVTETKNLDVWIPLIKCKTSQAPKHSESNDVRIKLN